MSKIKNFILENMIGILLIALMAVLVFITIGILGLIMFVAVDKLWEML